MNRLFLLFLPLALALSGCGNSDGVSSSEPTASVQDYFPLHIGDAAIQVQVPLTRTELSRGLMYRDELPVDHGMLFVYQTPQPQRFWMRNTKIPLDIGFFDGDGVLREVHSMQPYDETPVISARDDLQYALEVNPGWFRENGVFPGSQLDIDDLRSALRKRGATLRDYGLAK